MPACDEWTAVPAYMTVVHMVAKITGRIFVGAELCRHPEYLDSAVHYALDVLAAQKEIKRMSPLLRPLLAPMLASVRRLHEREKRATEFLKPVIQAKLAAKPSAAPAVDGFDDMMSAFISSATKGGESISPATLAKMQLGTIFAAVHTTSEAMTHM